MKSLALALCALLFAACSSLASPEESKSAVMVLFDVSASTDSSEIRADYLASFNSLFKELDPRAGGRVAADVIDDNPLAHSNLVSGGWDPYSGFEDNPQTFDASVDTARTELSEGVEGLLERTSKGTDVLNALDAAERFFFQHADADDQRLVVFSDMINTSREARFAKLRWNDDAIEKLLEQRLSAGQVPDLSGVRVCVVGAGVSNGELDAEKIQWIKRFWLAYFDRAGADLDEARYGASLIGC